MPKSQTTSTVGSAELFAVLDRADDTPLHAQLTRSLRDGVRSGRLRGGTALPSSRRLASELGVSRALVVEAYSQLVAEGYLVGRQGSATRVATLKAPSARADEAVAPAARTSAYDLRPGRPDPSLFPRRAWLAAHRHALSTATAAELGGYPDPAGPPALRTALAEYLGRVRGVLAAPERLIACAGVAQGIGLAAAALAASGVRRIAVEDPASPGTREVLAANGLEVEPVPVDRDGLDVAALSRSGAEAVLVTPAHQYPTGVVLSPARRAALLAWDGWIVEDDYDAEFRYDRAPVSALQGLAPDRVIYAGSVSKTLSPALRLGWLVAPGALLDDLRERKRLADLGCATLDALALARLLTTGGYDRHLRRARIAYRRRRDALAGALHPREIAGAAAGLHLTLVLPDRDAEQRAAAGNVLVSTLTEHYLGEPAAAGLLLGYAALPEPALTAAARALTLVPSPVESS